VIDAASCSTAAATPCTLPSVSCDRRRALRCSRRRLRDARGGAAHILGRGVHVADHPADILLELVRHAVFGRLAGQIAGGLRCHAQHRILPRRLSFDLGDDGLGVRGHRLDPSCEPDQRPGREQQYGGLGDRMDRPAGPRSARQQAGQQGLRRSEGRGGGQHAPVAIGRERRQQQQGMVAGFARPRLARKAGGEQRRHCEQGCCDRQPLGQPLAAPCLQSGGGGCEDRRGQCRQQRRSAEGAGRQDCRDVQPKQDDQAAAGGLPQDVHVVQVSFGQMPVSLATAAPARCLPRLAGQPAGRPADAPRTSQGDRKHPAGWQEGVAPM
jgi:hypothetical protein